MSTFNNKIVHIFIFGLQKTVLSTVVFGYLRASARYFRDRATSAPTDRAFEYSPIKQALCFPMRYSDYSLQQLVIAILVVVCECGGCDSPAGRLLKEREINRRRLRLSLDALDGDVHRHIDVFTL